MTLFDNIKKVAKERGLSLQSVAVKAGLSKNVIYQYNKGVNPSLETLANIANVLGVTVDYLLGKNDTPEWANDQDTHDLKEFLESNADSMTYGGDDLTQEEKEKLKIAMTQIFWNRHKHD
ncbi:helix-turn-helix domain-containing protein [Lapidilactobacillus gannanensis]|uniref:Helix-turn-helix domain-containing protein n=1 Tax=Lapidilactobacillus gannanensis TaxID=2486002 RepID=A0ABW4BK62_9LACO|nr:helix-turn-helix transcriptional regulator [Lapidilactobacillus gannanensis]